MANDKKFIVKNGLLTQENVVIGSTTDNGVDNLQVTGSSKLAGQVEVTASNTTDASLTVKNTAGILNTPIIASFEGDSDSLQIVNISTGDYAIYNPQQDNGIRFYDSTPGVEVVYNGSVDLDFNSSGIDFKREPTYNGYVFWNAGNDGSGSGLDADLLDGIDSTQFLRSDQDDTMNGSLTITGNLTVSGTTTTVNTETVLIADNLLTLNSNFTSGTPTENAGWEVLRGDEANSSLQWDETLDYFKLISGGVDLGRIITTADEGSGNGFDADTVDGLEAAQFLRSDADDTTTGSLTIEGNLSVDGNVTIGDDGGPIRVTFDMSGQNRILYGNSGEIGFLAPSLNYAVKLDTNDNWVVGANTVSAAFVDGDDNTYYGNFAGTSVINNINLEGNIAHNGDPDTYLTFGTDLFRVFTGGTKRLELNNTYTEVTTDLRAPRFVDNDDNNYYIDPASTSVANNIGIDTEIFHNGDTDTKIAFADNDIRLRTGGADRLQVNNTAVTTDLDVNAARFVDFSDSNYFVDPASTSVLNALGIDSEIFHNGDIDNKISFGSNTQTFQTGGATRLSLDNNSADFTVDVYAPRYYDSDDSTYYLDPAGDSQLNTVDIDDYIRHRDDLDTYVGFSAADTVVINTGGSTRLTANTSSITSTLDVYAPNFFGTTFQATGSVSAPIYYDSDDNNYYADFANTGTSILTAGNIGAGTTTADARISLNLPSMGFNPYAASNAFANFKNNGTTIYTMSGDSFGNGYLVMNSDTAWSVLDSSGNFVLTADAGNFEVIIGDQTSTYSINDNTPILGSNTNNKLHVSGSVQLFSNDDAYVVGNGTASFFKNNELGFGQGGGFYMDNANTVKVRNNKNISTSGDIYASVYYAEEAPSYYLNPNSNSQLKTVDIDDYIRHLGDVNNYFGFDGADQQVFATNGIRRMAINNTYVQADFEMRAPIFKDSADPDYSWNPNTTSSHRFTTPSGYVEIGPQDASYSHFQTDRAKYYFNTTVAFDGAGIEAYDANANAYFPRYYDWDDNDYYGDFAGTSKMRQLEFDTNNVQAPSPTDATTGARIILYPTGTAGNDYAIGVESSNMWFNSDEGFKYYTDGVLHTTLNDSFAQHNVEMRAPIFRDSDNGSYFGDFGSTSRMNVIHVNQIQMDNTSYIIDSPSGEYGTIMVQGGKGGYAGYAIENDWVFMSDGPTNMGLYNDTDNEWSLYAQRNDFTRIYANGVHQLSAEVGYGYAPNKMRSPVFEDADDPANYYGDFNSHSRMSSVSVGNQGTIANNTYALSAYHDNRHLFGMRFSGAGANYPWLVHDNYNYNLVGDKDAFIIHFDNIGDRLFLTEDGNMLITGEMSASNYNLSGGNENISLNPAYGSGLADDVLFDGTQYWEKRVIQSMQGAENGPTTATSEYVKNGDGPFGSSYSLRTSAYRDFYSDYIPVEGGEELYGEIAVRNISGSGGVLYYGIERYDENLSPIGSNNGTTFFVSNNYNHTSTSWTVRSAHHTLPANVRYVRIVVLMNYNTGGALREFGPPILKRSQVHSRIKSQDITVTGNVDATGYGYFGGEVRGTLFRDAVSTGFYMDPASGASVSGTWNFNNSTIDNVNNLVFNDPGPSEGIRWDGGNVWQIYESPNDLSTNSGGNLQFTTGSGNGTMRMRIESDGDVFAGNRMFASQFVDLNDDTYLVDPAGTSNINVMDYNRLDGPSTSSRDKIRVYDSASYAIGMQSGITYGGLNDWAMTFQMNNESDRGFWWGDTSHSTAQGAMSLTTNGILVVANRIKVGGGEGDTGSPTYDLDVIGTAYASTATRSPIFYDHDDDDYYGNFAGTSIMNTVRVNRLEFEAAAYNLDRVTGQYGSIRVTGNTNSYAGYAINDDWVFMSSGASVAGIYNDTDNKWAAIFRRNAETELMYDGVMKIETRSDGARIDGTLYVNDLEDRGNSSYYIDFDADSVLNNLTLNGSLTVAGYSQNNPIEGQWYQQGTYVYDSTNGTRYYWIRVGRANNGGTKAIMEYYAKDDVNTSGNAIGRIVFSSWNNSSISVDHHSMGGPQNSVTAQVRIDNSNYLWVRMEGNTWDSWLRWHWIRADGLTLENGSTRQEAAPANSTNDILQGQQIRATLGNLAGANPSNTTNYFGNSYNRGSVTGTEFIDVDNASRNANPGGISNFDTLRLNNLGSSLQINRGGTIALLSSSGITRGYIQATETNDAHLRIATSGGEDIAFYDGGTGGQRNFLIRGDGDTFTTRNTYASRYYDLNATSYWIEPGHSTSANLLGDVIVNDGKIRVHRGSDSFTTYVEDDSTAGGRAQLLLESSYSDLVVMSRNANSNRHGSTITLATQSTSTADYAKWVIGQGQYQEGRDLLAFAYGTNQANPHSILGTDNANYSMILDGTNNYLTVRAEVRAAIFRDLNSGSYYVDPSGFSNLNTGIRANEFYARNWFRNDNSGEGLYNQATAMHWYSDSNRRFRLYSTQSTSEILFTTAGNNARGYVYADDSNNIGFLRENGSWILRTRGNQSYVETYGDHWASRFVDRDDRSFYIDPAGTNSSRFRGVQSETMAYMGLSGQTRNSKEYYAARPRITSNRDYWTGAMGWGTINMNDVFNWGSGFIDSWSNPANQPSGTSHWTGIQALHYTNGSTRYGWQMVGGPIGNLRFRQQWGPSPGSWRTIPMLNVNSGNGGDLYASRFVDANLSSYYADPASTSRFNAMTINFLSWDNGWDIYDDSSSVLSIRSNDSDNGRIYFRDSNSTVCGSIYFDDDNHWGLQTPSNEWALYMERDARVYMYYNGTWEIRTASAYAEARGEFRAQNFRDTNSTGYYADPASTSRMNAINANVYYLNDGWAIYDDNNDTLNIRSSNSDHGEMRFRDSGDYCGRIYWDDDGSIMSMYHDNGEAIIYADQDYITYIYYNGTWEGRTRSGYFEARGSFRAPQFTDSNNAFYYTDPASTSRMNSIQAWGSITARFNITAYANYSDINKKENIVKIEGALDKVSQLSGYHFNYIGDDTRLTGVIAQEVEKVLPGIVYETEDLEEAGKTTLAVRYGHLTALLIESTKEQQDIINKQQEQLDEQQKQIDKLEEMVKMLMSKLDK